VRLARDRIRGEIIATARMLGATCHGSVADWWLEEMQAAVDAAERVLWGEPEPPPLPQRPSAEEDDDATP
jgi:hypothetical protein